MRGGAQQSLSSIESLRLGHELLLTAFSLRFLYSAPTRYKWIKMGPGATPGAVPKLSPEAATVAYDLARFQVAEAWLGVSPQATWHRWISSVKNHIR